MIKTIIFNIGGVIVSPKVEKIQDYVADYIGIQYDIFHEFFKKYESNLTKGKISFIDVYSETVKHFELKTFTPQDID